MMVPMNAPTTGYVELSDEQRTFFEDNGYLLIEGALPPEVVERNGRP